MGERAGGRHRRVLTHGAMALVAAVTVLAFVSPSQHPVHAATLTALSVQQSEQIATGVSYREGVVYTNGSQRQNVNVATIDVSRASVHMRPLLSNDMIRGRERSSRIAERYSASQGQPLVAINGDFWWPGHGAAPRGLHIQNGEVMAAGPLALPTLGIDDQRGLRMDSVKLNVTVRVGNASLTVSRVNGGRRPGELVLYTSRQGSTTPPTTWGTEVVLQVSGALKPSGTLNGHVLAVRRGSGKTSLGAGQMVLSGDGWNAGRLASMAPGQPVSISSETSNPAWSSMAYAIGGDQFIVRNGAQTPFNSARNPRTGIGLTASGNLVMVTVDGRQPGFSCGVTAQELGQLMLQLGAVSAINFDGGGSTTMAVRRPGLSHLTVVNSPSDGHERAVTSSLVVFGGGSPLSPSTPPPSPPPSPSPSPSPNPPPPAADTNPPSAPQDFTGQVVDLRQVQLSWQASTDDRTVELHYRVYRDGVQIGVVTSTGYVDRPTSGGSYRYAVRAVDDAGNISAPATPITITVC